ncbi:hypothetical protein CEXT_156991 [Caerostris extrusa]|uniref:Uncharacterized protein n=1 Tax=Caerostris extrusa TaxID=172846 RepID=A0AAV4P1Y2_CAEEX|nr:hypothetical protein CEXT_156991 [Caerostris extrusa]
MRLLKQNTAFLTTYTTICTCFWRNDKSELTLDPAKYSNQSESYNRSNPPSPLPYLIGWTTPVAMVTQITLVEESDNDKETNMP